MSSTDLTIAAIDGELVPGELVPTARPELLAQAGRAADDIARERVFADYHARKAPQTLRRNKADLLLFWEYLEAAGIPTGDLMHDPAARRGMTWGLVAGFVQWQLQGEYEVDEACRYGTVCQEAISFLSHSVVGCASDGQGRSTSRCGTRQTSGSSQPPTDLGIQGVGLASARQGIEHSCAGGPG